jgi:aminopeptidase
MTSEIEQYTDAMAELVVRFGANVQPGQVVAISCEPGKEQMVRAIAEHAYRAGAKFVDLSVFDMYLKRARALYGSPDDLGYVPPWMGERVLELGELRAARISLSGPSAPHALDDVDPQLIGLDMMPRVAESMTVVNDATTNWSIVRHQRRRGHCSYIRGWSRRRRLTGCGRRWRTSAGSMNPTRSPPGTSV